MNDFLLNTDFEETIRDYDFTRRAVQGMNRVLSAEDFEDMDTDRIFRYLMGEMEIVSFKDYLKRYIYSRAGIEEPFSMVDDDIYKEIIMDSFAENRAPHSFVPTTKKWSATVRGWLTQETVRRTSVFLLGYGLRMEAQDVSDFLTKVIKEEDFDFTDAAEVIHWFCYTNHLSYAKAQELLKQEELLIPAMLRTGEAEQLRAETALPDAPLSKREVLMKYLAHLKATGEHEQRQNAAYEKFLELYEKSREVICSIYQSDEEESGGSKVWRTVDITSGDIERFICSGIPLTKSGNLQKMSSSILSRQFRQRRMSRQRLDGLIRRQLGVERFDLITLLLFVRSETEKDADPGERCSSFVDEINIYLTSCGMNTIYPVNPYEAFVLMCLLADVPLAVYAEVWEKSYTEMND